MSIGKYIKEIGRGKNGARDLSREQASDLFGQILDQSVTDLEIGAFCLAMRIKGETPVELAGFLDATEARLQKISFGGRTAVVLPSYNGARKLPVLTPLLALLLAREGLPVVIHGIATESTRVCAQDVLLALGIKADDVAGSTTEGSIRFVPTGVLCSGLANLLEVRRVVGLRNSAHSVVKLMNPCNSRAVLIASYTHPEYAKSMTDTLQLVQANALLLRGTEGEPVADPRRTTAMHAFTNGEVTRVQDSQEGALASLPDLPSNDVDSTALWIQAVLDGRQPVPSPIALQVAHIVRLSQRIRMTP